MKSICRMLMVIVAVSAGAVVAGDTVTFEQAQLKVLAASNANNNHDFVVTKHEAKPYGWIFYVAPRRFVETKNTDFLVPGVGPIIVTYDGAVTEIGTYGPSEQLIQQFEATLEGNKQ